MKILLIGEYSRLHNSLKEGLLVLGHDVSIVSNGDGFKKYPIDFSVEAKLSYSKSFFLVRQFFLKYLNFDFASFEQGIRFYFLLPKLKGFDVVQLINERPIQTSFWLEKYLLKKIISHNKKMFLLSSGVDYISVKFLLERKIEKSIMNPYFENPKAKNEYSYVVEYVSEKSKDLHQFVYENCKGIIASDIDYVLPLVGNKKYLGLVQNAVNHLKIEYQTPVIDSKIIIFLGINQWNQHQKGITYFKAALNIIKANFIDKVEIIIAENLPYEIYIKSYDSAHILLDQCYAYDQGYNGLEAMAKGKVVFTGAEKEFLEMYQLKENEVCINAKADVDYLVSKLTFLVENPAEILRISKNARAFIEREHDYIMVAKKYLEVWKNEI
ncbi:glycosyltransferase [Flavobacterium sp.]